MAAYKKSLIPLALGGLGIGTTEFVMMGLLPDISKDFHITIPTAGHLISAYALGVVIGAPLLVVATSNIAPRKTLLILMALFSMFNFLSAFAPNPASLLIARFFCGLPHGAFFGVGSVVASRLADNGKQAQAISVMFGGLTLANLLTVPLGTFIGHHFGWPYTFAGVGIIGLVTEAALFLLLPDLPIVRTGNIVSELQIFKKPEPWLILVMTAIGFGGLFSWISYIAPLMTSVTHLSASSVPYVMMVAGLGMFAGNIMGGKLADKLRPITACLILLFAMSFILLAIFFFSGNAAVSLIMTFVAGSFAIALGAPITILMIKSTHGAETLGSSVTQGAFNIGNALGAFFGGLPIAAGLSYASPALVGMVMSLIGAGFALILMNYIKKVHKRDS